MSLLPLTISRHESINDSSFLNSNKISRELMIADQFGGMSSFEIDLFAIEEQVEKKSSIKAYILRFISIIFFSVSIVLSKLAYVGNPAISGFDYGFFRGGFLMFAGIIEAMYFGVNVTKIPREITISVILRTLTGAVGMPCFFIAIKYIPTSQGAIITSLNPLIGTILSFFFLAESFPKRNIIFLLSSCFGVILINLTKPSSNTISDDADMYVVGFLLCLVCLAFLSTGVVCSKHINQHVHSVYSPFYFSFGVFLNAIMTLFFCRDQLHFAEYELRDVLLLSSGCVLSYLSESLLSYATKFTTAVNLQPISYLNPCILLIIDIALFHYDFDQLYFIGFVVIFVSVMTPILIDWSK
ncbi:unnamed protein product [Moneuplotes crassus]|uniref:EamA domain-containing protein n=1 Tax=Euplotes crassus TaxID=5936 RepID=A0AAD1XI77_EUPCR|nr:unnamed protein product [Moneuplotes crassus]